MDTRPPGRHDTWSDYLQDCVLRRAAVTMSVPRVIGGGVLGTAIERPPPAEECVSREAEKD
jgi:hypothetical protein